MTEPTRLTGTTYTSLDDFRNREGGRVESFEVTDDEAATCCCRSSRCPTPTGRAAGGCVTRDAAGA